MFRVRRGHNNLDPRRTDTEDEQRRRLRGEAHGLHPQVRGGGPAAADLGARAAGGETILRRILRAEG